MGRVKTLRGAICALLLFSFTGCLDVEEPFVVNAPTEYAYECPSPTKIWNTPTVCVGTLAAPDMTTGEPNLAISATDPKYMAMGVNTLRFNNGTTTANLPPLHPVLLQPGTTPRTPLFVSEDGGASWTGFVVPRPANTSFSADASILIDPNGVLHFTGLNWANVSGKIQGGVFHVSTPDRGKTWSSPVQVSFGEDADRNWLSRASDGTLFLTWQNPKPETHIAVSRDDGRTWSRPLGHAGIRDCNLQTEVVETAAGVFLACARRAEQRFWTAVFRLDLARETVDPVAELRSGTGTLQLAPAPYGPLVLTYPARPQGKPDILVWTADAEAKDWSGPLSVRSLTSLDDDWNWTWLSEATPDPWGNHHILMVGGTGESCFNSGCADAATRRKTVHVILELGAGTLVGEELVTPLDPGQRIRPEGADVFSYFEEFHSIVFHQGTCAGFAAWGHDRYVDFTRIRPKTCPSEDTRMP